MAEDLRLFLLLRTSFTLNANRGIQVGATANTSISVKTGISVTYNGVIADKPSTVGVLAKQGAAILILGGVSTYSGATSINNGTIQLSGGNNRLPTGTTFKYRSGGKLQILAHSISMEIIKKLPDWSQQQE
jgi:autotransporter-associated beta strand protein